MLKSTNSGTGCSGTVLGRGYLLISCSCCMVGPAMKIPCGISLAIYRSRQQSWPLAHLTLHLKADIPGEAYSREPGGIRQLTICVQPQRHVLVLSMAGHILLVWTLINSTWLVLARVLRFRM